MRRQNSTFPETPQRRQTSFRSNMKLQTAQLEGKYWGPGTVLELHTGVLEGKIPEPPSLHIAREYVIGGSGLSTRSSVSS